MSRSSSKSLPVIPFIPSSYRLSYPHTRSHILMNVYTHARRRMVKRIYVPLPDAEGRRGLICHLIQKHHRMQPQPQSEAAASADAAGGAGSPRDSSPAPPPPPPQKPKKGGGGILGAIGGLLSRSVPILFYAFWECLYNVPGLFLRAQAFHT